MIRSVVKGIGSYLPERILSNAELSEKVETSDEWIRERTGIGQRHIAAVDQCTSDLGLAAAKAALADAGITADDVDLIVVATTTPDYTFPSTETFSRILDWEDRTTCVLFGDGAGAIVLSAQEGAEQENASGILNTFIRSNGEHRELLYVDGGPSKTQTVGHVRMIGNQVFKHAVKDISAAMQECADGAGVPISDIDWFVPHQANQRILNGVAKRLKLDPEQVISTVEFHANTSAASVPLAMDAAVKDGRIKKGDLVMLEAFGGGFTWGAALLRY